ncbi:hypothetical protein Tco_1205961, partial [Tanacetum coccineum]
GLGHIARECPRPKRLQDSDYFKDKMLLMQAQENGAVLDEEQSLFLAGEQIINFDEDVCNSPENDLALNMDHIFEADECDAFDSDVDEDDIPMKDKGHVSDLEDTDNAHIPKVSTTTWFKPIPEGERPATPEPEWTIPPNDFPEPENGSADKLERRSSAKLI